MMILAPEYPGYSIYSGVEPSCERILEDADDLIAYLGRVIGIGTESIVLIGRSIGSGTAVDIATRYKVSCLILISPFLSLQKAAKEILGNVGSLLVRNRFDNESLIPSLRCPLLILHGDTDTIIPLIHSQILIDKATVRKRLIIIQRRGHQDLAQDGSFFEEIGRFVRENTVGRGGI